MKARSRSAPETVPSQRGDRLDVTIAHPGRAGVAQAVLEQDLHRHGQAGDVSDAPAGEGREAVVCDAGHDLRARSVAIAGAHHTHLRIHVDTYEGDAFPTRAPRLPNSLTG